MHTKEHNQESPDSINDQDNSRTANCMKKHHKIRLNQLGKKKLQGRNKSSLKQLHQTNPIDSKKRQNKSNSLDSSKEQIENSLDGSSIDNHNSISEHLDWQQHENSSVPQQEKDYPTCSYDLTKKLYPTSTLPIVVIERLQEVDSDKYADDNIYLPGMTYNW